ncbi:PadR family transcriptional regulator [Lutibacter sp. B2]|nr:PadR family transcriptional regulator [Lutibacter sp. B2]
MNIQFKKGVLELCVLVLLDKKDCYGYELVETISKYINISEGTIYPLLRRLQKEGYFTSYLKESSEGPPRKYYKITDVGKRVKNELIDEWGKFIKGVDELINREEGKDE